MEEKEINQLISQRIQKLNNIKNKNINPYPNKYERTENSLSILENYEENKEVSVAGRLITKRKMGKAAFAHLKDEFGKLQIYVRINEVGKEKFKDFIKFDIGDFIGVKGKLFITNTGHKSVLVDEYELLSKSLRPLPEKWHGLKDTEIRYRQRYVDLIVNEDVMETFKKRTLIIQKIREYLNKENFLEVETPMMQQLAGGAIAKPFMTHHNSLDMNLYLRIAPELYLKRLIVGGFEKVYELNRNFRNEGISSWHNPEFTMLEIYQAYADYNVMMELTENLITDVVEKVLASDRIENENGEIIFKKPFERITMLEAIKKYTGLDAVNASEQDLEEYFSKNDIEVEKGKNKFELINEMFEIFVESKLIQPTFIIDYPRVLSPLAKPKTDDPDLVERFELFINGKEIGNAYSELNDPIEQAARFREQAKNKLKVERNKKLRDLIDSDYLRALEYGMPPTGGLGIGIDRLIMILTNNTSIRDVVLFPLLKKEDK